MAHPLRIALVAHDHKKPALIAWAQRHEAVLKNCELCATGTTGTAIEAAIGLPVKKFLSGPLGGDLQLGAAIAEGQLDLLIFFWDPLTAQPHDPDVKALLRVAVLWDIPFACNEISSTLLINSPHLKESINRNRPDYHNYRATYGSK